MTHPLEDENRRLRELLNLASNHVPLSQLTLRENIDADLSSLPGGGDYLPQRDLPMPVYEFQTPNQSSGGLSPPPPPTQGEEERARSIVRHHVNRQYRARQPPFPPAFYADELVEEIAATLRQRADEATRAENEACAELADRNPFAQALDIAFAIRARIAPKGQP